MTNSGTQLLDVKGDRTISDWPDSKQFWHKRRVMVTGGNGFLGKNIVCKLKELDADVFIADIDRHDLHRLEDIRRALSYCKPQMAIHLAARVGGIGANRKHPAEFFYNLMMGVPFLHKSWVAGVERFAALETARCYPGFTPVSFCEENLWDGFSEATNAPQGPEKRM